jgi:hypothetical protein
VDDWQGVDNSSAIVWGATMALLSRTEEEMVVVMLVLKAEVV